MELSKHIKFAPFFFLIFLSFISPQLQNQFFILNEGNNFVNNSNFSEEKSNNILVNQDSNWNITANDNIKREFEYQKNINQSNKSISINECSDWLINNNFSFENLRCEKIVNGDAESNIDLWTDYIPLNYEGNVTRDVNPLTGKAITDNYSWYFDIISNDHTTIVGFDNPINVYSDSVIFNLSYNLLRNNLGSSYDSNICIRLFFQFDIYIFLWFNGNPGVLSNVTGPGGYADLLINEASFDGETHNYLLNITALGLELFDQKPDQLKSFAIQTWGELPYQMEFLIDDLSLTDYISPDNISLSVNTFPVIGSLGFGSVYIESDRITQITYQISYSSSEEIYWNGKFSLKGTGYCTSLLSFFYENSSKILRTEYSNDTFTIPFDLNNNTLLKTIPKDWLVKAVNLNDEAIEYIITNLNETYNELIVKIVNFNNIELQFYFENYINNIILSKNEMTHDDLLSIYIESKLPANMKIILQIIDNSDSIRYENFNLTNTFGETSFINIKLNSTLSRGNYTIIVYHISKEYIGIGRNEFNLITYPTILIPDKAQINTNYREKFTILVNYLEFESNSSIDTANVSYEWLYGTGFLQQNSEKQYFVEIIENEVNIGRHLINILAGHNGYASSITTIELNILFSNFSLILETPLTVNRGEEIALTAEISNNNTILATNLNVRFMINNEVKIETTTDISGHASISYNLPTNYSFTSVNISCSIIINGVEFLKNSKLINVNLIQISPSIITLGIGTLILTVISSFLLIKKKSNISHNIQI